ncbi:MULTISPECIES: 2-amino-4-hydroxy-6-hydroxymethyldihydropteridine diphosphokinase [unclassified Thioalkalivibrio]|uniref:2-amino-4-hydroxy-6- hydroxymethyldihydropteridine diphosphokinase n=1 Tax=unclassified Thioalkalivibrio TaxID=2621013 RepID=UPI00036C5FE5|nr:MULTISPECIES: 2-amino-4-hydroxy-6-hydroxymethyldihydropteridine diphosphokinase [unclassified Thioalkalivibrio]
MSSEPARGVHAFIGIGANLGDPETQVRDSFARLAHELPQTRLIGRSRLFRNPPMGPQDQPDYVNAVARLHTRLEPLDLLAALQAIECACGRERDGTRWGPRLLDLDLLLFGEHSLDLPGLKVPHAGIAERDFVILPLLELAPSLQIPGVGPLERLAQRFDGASLIPIAEPQEAVATAEGRG